MVFGKDYGSRIVRSWPGQGTAETLYQTEDGSVWRHDACVTPVDTGGTTGSRLGKIVGDRIVPSA